MKRLIALAIALMLCVSCITVSAEESAVYTTVAQGTLSSAELAGYRSSSGISSRTVSGVQSLDNIRDAMLDFKENIYVYDFKIPYSSDMQEISAFMGTVFESYPELFFISRYFEFTHYKGYLYSVHPKYMYSEEQTAQLLEEFYTYIKNITARMSADWSQLEKVVYIHDYLATDYQYDDTNTIYDAYNFFKNGTGACEGYALAFCALARAVGLNCVQVRSIQQNHIWNAVEIDGEYYHIDVTWDDPVPDLAGRVKHDYFLMTDSETASITATFKNAYTGEVYTVSRDDFEIVGDTEVSCDSTRFSSGYQWEDCDSCIVFVNGAWYKLEFNFDTNNTYIKRVSSDWQSSSVAAYVGNYNWMSSSNGYWPGYFGGLYAIGSTVYTNTPNGLWYCSLNSNSPVTGTVDVTPIVGERANDIYGSSYSVSNGNIVLEYKTDPNTCDSQRVSFSIAELDPACTSLSDALVRTRKLITKRLSADFDAYLDLNGDMIIDIRDLVAVKKLLVM